jgi:hypothetical protein
MLRYELLRDNILTDGASGCIVYARKFLFVMDSFPEDIPAMKRSQHRVEMKCEWVSALTRIILRKDPRKTSSVSTCTSEYRNSDNRRASLS